MPHGSGPRVLPSVSARRLRRDKSSSVDGGGAVALTARSLLGSTAVVIPLTAAGVTLLRLYGATGYNISLTITSLGVVNRSQLLLGTLLTSLVLASFIVIFLSAYYVASRWPEKRTRTARDREPGAVVVARYFYPAVMSLTASIVVLVVMTPIVVVGAALLLSAMSTSLGFLMRHLFEDAGSSIEIPAPGSRAQLVAWGGYASLITVGVLVLTIMASAVFPLQTFEKVRTKSGTYSNVWVMGAQGDQTLLMNASQEARWVKTSSIVTRQVCAADSSQPPWTLRSLAEIRSGRHTTTNLNDYTPRAAGT